MTDDEVGKTEERLFELHALRKLAEAESRLGYTFFGVRRLFAEKGAVAAVIYLLDVAHGGYRQDGFNLLAVNDLLDNSIEQSVIDFEKSGLFPKMTILSARLRLNITKDRLERERQDGSESEIVPDPQSRS